MTYESLESSKLPLWIKRKNDPFEYFHFDGIEYIVCSFRVPLKIDSSYKSQDGVRIQVEYSN